MAKAETAELGVFSSKKMLEDNGKKGTVIKFNERLKVEVIKETKHYSVGMILEPHKVKGLALIEQGIAKEVKEK